MSYEDAVSALTEAAKSEDNLDVSGPLAQQAPVAPPAVETPQGEQTPPAVQPESQAGQPEPADTDEQFFNPDTLDPALLPGWKQLQAAFTQKTQQLAAERRQLEQLGDPETLSAAVELYERISDPENWQQLHAELTEALVEMGMTPAEAKAAATEGMQAQTPAASLDLDDPDLAPVVNQLTALQAQQAQQQALLEQLQAERYQAEQMAEAQRQQAEYLAHMQQQVSSLRQANPHYDDGDIAAIVEIGSFYNDDLGQAQARYEEIVASRLERYFAQKQGAQAPALQPHTGAGVLSSNVTEPQTLREAEEEAVEYMRALQAAGELDF